jgi:hypothetical protein
MKRFGAFVVFALVLAACSSGSGTGGTGRSGPAIGMDVRRSVVSANPAAVTSDSTSTNAEQSGPSGPAAAVVPDVRGMVFSAAVHRLWRAGIAFRLVYGRESNRPLWSVIEENPSPGSDTPGSGRVNLVLSLHHQLGAGVIGIVRCKPEAEQLADPYCLGKLLKYSGS